MYFYNLSSGEYSDYNYTLIMTDKKLTRQEFISLYNEAVQIKEIEDSKEGYNDQDVADVLCEKFGFSMVKEELEINCDWLGFEKITDEKDINGDHIYIKSPDGY